MKKTPYKGVFKNIILDMVGVLRSDRQILQFCLSIASVVSAASVSVMAAMMSAVVISGIVIRCRLNGRGGLDWFSMVMAVVTDPILVCVNKIIADPVCVYIQIAVVITDTIAVCIDKIRSVTFL